MQLMRRKEIPCFLGMEGEGILVGSSRVKNKILRAPKRGVFTFSVGLWVMGTRF